MPSMMTLKEYFAQQGRGSQTELARAVGTSKGYLSQITKGERFPGRELAKKIEDATDGKVPAWRLLDLDEPEAA